MKKNIILIILGVFFVNNFCMELDVSESESSDIELKEETDNNSEFLKDVGNIQSFKNFFVYQEYKKDANDILSDLGSKISINTDKEVCILFLLPVDILKEIIFDYLVNTKSIDEQEIYRNFKSLALSCKKFSALGKIIMAQIVVISEKQIMPELRENVNAIHNGFTEFTSIFSKKIISVSNAPFTDVLVAVRQNRALWLFCNKNKIKHFERNNRLDLGSKDFHSIGKDHIEMGLFIAIENDSFSAAKILLNSRQKFGELTIPKHMTRVMFDDLSPSPLHIAVKNLNRKFVKFLLDFGEDVNEINNSGDTPLYELIISTKILVPANHIEAIKIIKILLDHGAKNLTNKHNITPLLAAEMRNYYRIIKLLKSHFEPSSSNSSTNSVCKGCDII